MALPPSTKSLFWPRRAAAPKPSAATGEAVLLKVIRLVLIDQSSRDGPPGVRADAPDRPRLIFFCELAGQDLLDLLQRPNLLDQLAAGQYGVALSAARLEDTQAQAARLLNARGVPTIAWLLLPPEAGFAFNLQNYPQAAARYQAFRAWALAHELRFEAVGLDIDMPPIEVGRGGIPSARELARRLWLASENVLYTPARAAYADLITAIRHDGYEVHVYQAPFIADDRRAGTTLVQRALDIVDLPADLDVLMCSSSVTSERLDYDLGGALIASYGPAADAIAVGGGEADPDEERAAPLPWPALRRDLLLAAQHTDTIYVFSLEDCVERGMFERLATLSWDARARAAPGRRALIGLLRGALFALLIAARFGRATIAWAGWALAIMLWVRGRRAARKSGE